LGGIEQPQVTVEDLKNAEASTYDFRMIILDGSNPHQKELIAHLEDNAAKYNWMVVGLEFLSTGISFNGDVDNHVLAGHLRQTALLTQALNRTNRNPHDLGDKYLYVDQQSLEQYRGYLQEQVPLLAQKLPKTDTYRDIRDFVQDAKHALSTADPKTLLGLIVRYNALTHRDRTIRHAVLNVLHNLRQVSPLQKWLALFTHSPGDKRLLEQMMTQVLGGRFSNDREMFLNYTLSGPEWFMAASQSNWNATIQMLEAMLLSGVSPTLETQVRQYLNEARRSWQGACPQPL